MAGIYNSIRFYSALLWASIQFLLTQVYRKLLRIKHPKGWPADQEFKLLLMKQVFKYGDVLHWRQMISGLTTNEVPGLQLTRIPASTFKVDGCRDSWWVELPPEQQPERPKASLVLMYLHGGGFVSGDPLMYRPTFKAWLRRLAEQGIQMRIFAVGYPLASEHRFPAGLLGTVAAYDWLVEQLGGSNDIVLGGDSAGGNLTIAALEYMRQRASGCIDPAVTAAAAALSNSSSAIEDSAPFHLPVAALLVSPAVDLSSSSVFALPAAEAAELFCYDYVAKSEGDTDRSVTHSYLPQPVDLQLLQNPLVSPVYMSAMAPRFDGLEHGLIQAQGQVLVVAGGCEAMTPDITRFVKDAKALFPKAELQYHVEPDEPHCWCVIGMPHLLTKGLPVLVPFFARAAAAANAAKAKRLESSS